MNLTKNALALTRLIGKKHLTFGCLTQESNGTMWLCGQEWFVVHSENGSWGGSSEYHPHMGEIIGHPVTIDDVYRWQKENKVRTINVPSRRSSFKDSLPLHHPDNDQACKELVDFISNYK